MRRAAFLSLPLQLGFPGVCNENARERESLWVCVKESKRVSETLRVSKKDVTREREKKMDILCDF
jgi:hypothetical protein